MITEAEGKTESIDVAERTPGLHTHSFCVGSRVGDACPIGSRCCYLFLSPHVRLMGIVFVNIWQMSKHSSSHPARASLIFSLFTLISVCIFQTWSLWESDVFTRVLQNNDTEPGNERATPGVRVLYELCKHSRSAPEPWEWSRGLGTHRHLVFLNALFLKRPSLFGEEISSQFYFDIHHIQA